MSKLVITISLLGLVGLSSAACEHQKAVASDCVPLSADARIAAMLSVHAHAYAARGLLPDGQTPTSLGLQQLGDAVQALRNDCDRLASSRRRRAAAKLAAYGGNQSEVVASWKALIDDPALVVKVEEVLRPPTDADPAPKIEGEVFDVLADMTRATDCKLDTPVFKGPDFDPNGGTVSWEISFTADRSAQEVAERIDPQRWKDCGAFFPETFYTTKAPARVSSCASGPGASPLADDTKKFGTAYQAMLFEHFNCPKCTSELENLLTITTVRGGASCTKSSPCDPDNPTFQVCYSLDSSRPVPCGDPPQGQATCPLNALYGCVDEPKKHVDLRVDQGDLSACATTSGQRMFSRKTIKFDKPFDNLAAWTLFALGQKEQTDSWIEMVCCKR